jgi:hypothetical protein
MTMIALLTPQILKKKSDILREIETAFENYDQPDVKPSDSKASARSNAPNPQGSISEASNNRKPIAVTSAAAMIVYSRS